MGTETIKSCCHGCHEECGVLIHVKNGELEKIEGNPEDPRTHGHMCCKGLSYKKTVYHPDRITRPLRKVGENEWEPISWEDALTIVAEELNGIKEEYGPESVLFLHGTSRGEFFTLVARLANTFGSPNWSEPGWAQCFYPRLTAANYTYGRGTRKVHYQELKTVDGHFRLENPSWSGYGDLMECPDFENTHCILVWGGNPPATWPVFKAGGMIRAKARGASLIVVDPRFSETVSKADLWLRLRPGTDCALALGMLNVIINEELYDKEFVRKWTYGFDKLKERVQEYSLDKVEEITWVPKDKIRKAARMYAEAESACIFQCVAIDHVADPVQTARAIALLPAITGNVDKPGGNVFTMSTPIIGIFTQDYALEHVLPLEQRKKALGHDKYSILCSREQSFMPSAHCASFWPAVLEGKPYPIKAAYVHGSNPAASYANSNVVRKALEKLDFIVVVDLFMTKTAKMSDIILPASTWVERDGIVTSLQATYCNIYCRQKAIQVGECIEDEMIISKLAEKLGLGKYFWNSQEDRINERLKPLGITFKELKEKWMIEVPFRYCKYEHDGFDTPTGKIELYSTLLEKYGYDPLPFYTEPFESPYTTPELYKEYPLILTTGGRVTTYRHTEGRNNPWLREIYSEPWVEIHEETARKYGIKDGDLIIVESPRGVTEVRARVTLGIDPRVVQVVPGWEEATANFLTDHTQCAKGMGTTTLRGLLCRIRRK